MPNLDDLARVERLAWAALEGGPIDGPLQAMCDALGGVTGSAALLDPTAGLNAVPYFANVDPALAHLITTRFDTPDTNPFMAALPRMEPGQFLHCSSILDMRQLKRTAFYADWWVPTRVNDHGGGVRLTTPDGRIVWSVIGCMDGRDWLDREELRFAAAACGTITQALRTAASHAHAHTVGLLDGRVPDPSWLLDGRRVLRLANTAGERMLDAARGPLRRRRGGLEAVEASLARRLDELIPAVLQGRSTGGTLAARDGALFAKLVVEAGPRYRDDRSIMLTLRSSRPVGWEVDGLRSVFGLTHREAEVALALCDGARASDIALAMNLTPGSVRLYLKRIFAKTGAHGQGPLIAMLIGGQTESRRDSPFE